MKSEKQSSAKYRGGEQGSAILIAVIFMAMLFTLTVAAASTRVSYARASESRRAQQEEYWGARSGAAAVEASLRADIPTAFDSDVQLAKTMTSGREMPAFDRQDVPATASKPVMTTHRQRSAWELASCTSLLGNVDAWAQARSSIANDYAQQLGFTSRVATFREAFRPSFTSPRIIPETSYALEFLIDSQAGENGRVRPSGIVLLGPAIQGCNTSAVLAISPDTVQRGNSASLVVTYENASRVIVRDQSGAVIADQAVADSPATQTLTLTVAPNSTTTYTATATNAAGCSATTAGKTLTVTEPPPQIVSFAANPTCIVRGQTSTLSWSITGATAAAINGTPVDPNSGTMAVTPTDTTDYTLVASNATGSVQAQLTVSVTVPPTVNLFTADPSCIVADGSSTLRWNVSDAASATINGTPVSPSSGTMTVTPNDTTSYTIVVTGAGCNPQTATATATVSVSAPPRINLFSASPNPVTAGSSSVIEWNISGAASATINGTPVSPSSGTMTVTPDDTTSYTIVATGAGCNPQQAQATVTITVQPIGPGSCPLIQSFSAAPSCILAGQNSALTWAVTDADSVTINGSPVGPGGGTISVSPSATTVYTLVATRSGCPPQQAQVTVQVGDAPVVNSFTPTPGTMTRDRPQRSSGTWRARLPSPLTAHPSTRPAGACQSLRLLHTPTPSSRQAGAATRSRPPPPPPSR